MPLPVMRMAPKPRRFTGMSPPTMNWPEDAALGELAIADVLAGKVPLWGCGTTGQAHRAPMAPVSINGGRGTVCRPCFAAACRIAARAALAQLAVLAAAAVVAADRALLLVLRILAGHAQAHAGHRLAACLGDRRLALLAVAQARPLRQLAARALDRVLHGRVDLVLYGAVAGPTDGHGGLREFTGTWMLPRPK